MRDAGNRVFFAGRAMPGREEWKAAAERLTTRHALPFDLAAEVGAGCAKDLERSAPILRD